MVTIRMTSGKQINIELCDKEAPVTTANFKNLVSRGFYDGLCFHRVIAGFMIQGGCPKGTGTGGPGYSIKGEFSANGVPNSINHKRGVISMARSSDYDSAGSQFFITHGDAEFLDGQYAAFGHVTFGMDVVDSIAAQQTDASDRPLAPQIIERITLSDDEAVTKPQ